MSIKKLIVLIIILILVLGAIFAFFFFRNGGQLPIGNNEENPFPISNDPGFGSFPGNNNGSENEPENEPTTTPDGEIILPTLRKLSDEPTSGIYTYKTVREVEEIEYNEDGSEVIVKIEVPETKFQIIERKNGHITEFNSLDLDLEKLSNTSIVKVRNVLAGDGGYLMQYMADFRDVVVSFLGQIITEIIETENGVDEEGNPIIIETKVTKLEGTFLPERVLSQTLSRDKDAIAYLVPSEYGSTLYTTPINSFTPTVITSLPLTELEVLWPNDDEFIFYTKADSRTTSYVFRLDSNNELRTLVSDIYGLTALPSPDGNNLFISYYVNGEIQTAFINLTTGVANTTPIKTVAEKCVWSNTNPDNLYCGGTNAAIRGEFPEDWYMGISFFADVVWELDAQSGQATIVSYLDENNTNEPFDIISPILSPGDEYFVFINKYNRKPWVLDLVQAAADDVVVEDEPEKDSIDSIF